MIKHIINSVVIALIVTGCSSLPPAQIENTTIALANKTAENISIAEVKNNCSLYLKSNTFSKVLAYIPKESKIAVLSFQGVYFLVKYQNKIGYVDRRCIISNDATEVLIDDEWQRRESEGTSKYGFETSTKKASRLVSKPAWNADVLERIPNSSKITVYSYSLGHFKINYSGKVGYVPKKAVINYEYLISELESKKKIKVQKKREEKAQAKQRELEEKAKAKQLELEANKKEAIRLEIAQKRNEIEIDKKWVIPFTANIRKNSSINSPVVDVIDRGDYVFIQEQRTDWYRVYYYYMSTVGSIDELQNAYKKGWIHKNLLSSSKIDTLSDEEWRRWTYVENNPHIPDKFKKVIKEGIIILGMSKTMAIASWGKPKDINRTVNKWGTREQWIYGDVYIYFNNDELTSWQD